MAGAAHIGANAIDSELRHRLASVSSISLGDVLTERAGNSGALREHHTAPFLAMGVAIGMDWVEQADWEGNRAAGATHFVG